MLRYTSYIHKIDMYNFDIYQFNQLKIAIKVSIFINTNSISNYKMFNRY